MSLPTIDHSKLEEISYADSYLDEEDDEIYLSEEDIEEELDEAKDSFPDETVVANKKCRIYPKSRHYALIRFGTGFADRAIALPKVICHEDEMIDGEKMMAVISWGHEGWINARRDNGGNCPVSWKATLVWTGMRKPGGANNAHHNDEQWKRLLMEYHDLGTVDVSMKRVPVPTLKSVASELNGPEKPSLDAKEVGMALGKDLMRTLSLGGRDFSNMLEEIDVTMKDDFNDSDSNMSKSKPFVVAEELQFCGTVQKVGRECVTFMPIQVFDGKISKQYHGSYSASVPRTKLYVKGEFAGGGDLKLEVGDSVNFICDLLFDEESKERFCDVKIAWNGRKPELSVTCTMNDLDLKSKGGDSLQLNDNKSLEPISVEEGFDFSDSESPSVIKNVIGEVKKISPSFICVNPYKQEYQSSQAYPLMSQHVYLANGKVGSSYSDLTQTDLKVGSQIRMNLSKIDDKIIVLSAWQPGAKCPKNDEAKAMEYAKLIRKKSSSKSSPKRSRNPFEEPTPTSQMSARPHSPSYFRTGDLRRPKSVKETLAQEPPPPPLPPPATPKPPAVAKKSCLREEKHTHSISFSDCPVKTITLPKPIVKKALLDRCSPPLASSSSSTISFNIHSTCSKEPKDVEPKYNTFVVDERRAPLPPRVDNNEFALNAITKVIESLKLEAELIESKAMTPEQFTSWSKKTFADIVGKQLQKSSSSLGAVSSLFEGLITQMAVMNIKYENSSGKSAAAKPEANMVEKSAQTAITGPVFFRDCFLE